MAAIIARLLTLSWVLMLATDETANRVHDHDLPNALCPSLGLGYNFHEGI